MAVIPSLETFLHHEHVPFVSVAHPTAKTAPQGAAAAHIQRQCWAKTVVFFADDKPIQAVVPADLAVSLRRLRKVASAREVRLATEAELTDLYPGCEAGAMPPLGPMYGQPVFVDETLAAEPQIAFSAGTHSDAILVAYNAFAKVARPVVGAFGVRRRLPR